MPAVWVIQDEGVIGWKENLESSVSVRINIMYGGDSEGVQRESQGLHIILWLSESNVLQWTP